MNATELMPNQLSESMQGSAPSQACLSPLTRPDWSCRTFMGGKTMLTQPEAGQVGRRAGAPPGVGFFTATCSCSLKSPTPAEASDPSTPFLCGSELSALFTASARVVPPWSRARARATFVRVPR